MSLQPKGRIDRVGWVRRFRKQATVQPVPGLAAVKAVRNRMPGWGSANQAEPMTAVSVWGGAHDGARLLIARRSVQEHGHLWYLGDRYTYGYDHRAGWRAIHAGMQVTGDR